MVRPVAPLWLARPSRFAALDRATARIVAALAALLFVASFAALVVFAPPPDIAMTAGEESAAPLPYDTIAEQVRHGADYYVATAQEMRHAGAAPPPFFLIPLPTLTIVQAHVPAIAGIVLLGALVAAVGGAWFVRLRPALPRRRPRLLATLLLIAGVAPFAPGTLAGLHEMWAGLLVALSLAVRRPGNATPAIALGLCAMLIGQVAALYTVIMLAGALLGGRRREALGWIAALAVFAGAMAAHAGAVAAVAGGFDAGSWGEAEGAGFAMRAMTQLTALSALPVWIGAPLVALALVGWAAWRDPLGLRVLAVLGGYSLLLATCARADDYYWAMIAAPLLLPGLAFAPDGVRDLWRAASARRRITVTRKVSGA